MKINEIAKHLRDLYERGEFDPEVYQDYNALMELDITERGNTRGHVSYETEVATEDDTVVDDFEF